MSEVKAHDLKILPEYFKAVVTGKKLFEIRKNDRDYNEGDQVMLREWSQEAGYSGLYALCEVTYVTNYAQKDGYVVFGIRIRRKKV